MKTVLVIFAIAAIVLALSFCGIGIKMFLKKNGEFKRRCANVDPYTGDRSNCVCGKQNVFKTTAIHITNTHLWKLIENS